MWDIQGPLMGVLCIFFFLFLSLLFQAEILNDCMGLTCLCGGFCRGTSESPPTLFFFKPTYLGAPIIRISSGPCRRSSLDFAVPPPFFEERSIELFFSGSNRQVTFDHRPFSFCQLVSLTFSLVVARHHTIPSALNSMSAILLAVPGPALKALGSLPPRCLSLPTDMLSPICFLPRFRSPRAIFPSFGAIMLKVQVDA